MLPIRSAGFEALVAAALTALNAWIAAQVFGLDYHEPLSSIEPAYMAIARWMTERPDADWFPLWYLGLPIQHAYPPVLPSLTSSVSQWAALEPAAAYHWVAGTAYAAGPACFYILARRLGLSVAGAAAAGVGLSVASPAALLFPSVWEDLGRAEGPRRLDALVRYGEGPHILSLTLWPLAAAALREAVERRTPLWVGLAALGAASVALTNWLGSVALAIAAVSLLLASGWDLRRWRTAAGVGALGYAVICPWLPLSTIQTVRANAPRAGGDYPMGATQTLGWIVLLLVVAVAAWGLSRWKRSGMALRFGVLFSLLLGAPAAVMEISGVHLMPQPHRFQLELEQGLWLLAGAAMGALIERFGRRAWVPGAVAVLVLATAQTTRYRSFLDSTVEPVVKERMPQHEAAQALVAYSPQARLFAAGSVEFWLNVFADNPQVGGAFDQGVLWSYFQQYRYGITHTRNDPERTARWLRLTGADVVFVAEPDSRAPFRSYWSDPYKLKGSFEEIWRDGGDVLYAVPDSSPSLAHVVGPGDVIKRVPVNNEDDEPLRALDAALSDPARRLSTRWESPDHLVIEGEIEARDRIFVQVAWQRGWDAFQDSLPVALQPGAMGMMLLEPTYASGRIDLRYKGTASFYLNDGESLLHHATRVTAVVIWLAWLALARRRW